MPWGNPRRKDSPSKLGEKWSLYTPHTTLYLYTLHFTPYTLHSTLYTLHSTHYTPHSTLHTLHSTLHTLHSTLYTPHCTLHTLHPTPCTLHSTVPTSRSTHYIPHSTLHFLHTPHFALHPLPYSAVYSALVGNRGKMYKTLQIICFTKALYVTAFGFVGCILFYVGLSENRVCIGTPLHSVERRFHSSELS